MNTKQLIDEVVSLPVEERTLLVDTLLQSLNRPESEIDRQWAVEAQKRLTDIRSGSVQAISGKKIFDKVVKRFAK
ncbi:MAG: addiction module protein [Proteobacteria bacterium]|nr:addiction module protein [Pseudomonadota bacterium]